MSLKGLGGLVVFLHSSHRQDISEKPWVPLSQPEEQRWGIGQLQVLLGSRQQLPERPLNALRGPGWFWIMFMRAGLIGGAWGSW